MTAYFDGQVQGVGFRYTVCRTAERFAVAGFVRNLSDGRVELVAEGDPADLQRLLAAVQEVMAEYIQSTQVDNSPGTGQFARFSVAY